MTNRLSNSPNDFTGRQEIRSELVNRLGYPIMPSIRAIYFVQTLGDCLIETVEISGNDEKGITREHSLEPFLEGDDPILSIEKPFAENLHEFLETIEPFDFTPLAIDLYTHEVEELITEEYCRNQRSGKSPENL